MRRTMKILRSILMAINLLVILLMLLTGFSYLVAPTRLPIVAPMGLLFPFFLASNLAFLVLWLMVRWRYAWVPILAFVLCYTPVHRYISFAFSTNLPEGALKVLSYNVLEFKGMNKELTRDDNQLVYFLLNTDADIMCLQECAEKNLSEEMYAQLYEKYPYHHFANQGKELTTLSIYSKYEILRVDSIPCDTCKCISLAYTVVLPKGYAMIVNNHFESNKFAPKRKSEFRNLMLGELGRDSARAESKYIYRQFSEIAQRRTSQVQAVRDFLDLNSDVPTILCGDFNDIPISYNYNLIYQALTDCFHHVGLGPGWTYCHNGMRVRIDNIMCSSHFIPYRCKVLSSVNYSDHYPVLAWLDFREEEP